MSELRALHPRLAGLPERALLGRRLRVAATTRSRLLGLARIDRELAGDGLLIGRCRSIHTFGMRFPIVVLFVDRQGIPVSAARLLGPRRISTCRHAWGVVEIPAGAPPPETGLTPI